MQTRPAADRVATWGNHGLLLVRREGDGAAETHLTQVDMITVVSGEGTLVVGGTMVDGKTTAPNEIRGKSINGGVRKPMARRRRVPHSRRDSASDAGAEEPRDSGSQGRYQIDRSARSRPGCSGTILL